MALNGIVNLSSKPLAREEISLLQRGLKFCPTPPCPGPGQARKDLDALHRRMRLLAHFEENHLDALKRPKPNTSSATPAIYYVRQGSMPSKDSKFRQTSTWRPIGPAYFEAFIASNQVDFNSRLQTRKTLQERG